ncbi:hypothetical protein Lalb_Chr01g0020441 [Lupinus albus]|uniref:Uncharacterized protein n=1 Tax=Lupinus albus TaxID=3870 RepID=A0A6A4R541_LUPAL|nr:hypothetical protein Lalb_Chr01g0020441 [Lupinus albus]
MLFQLIKPKHHKLMRLPIFLKNHICVCLIWMLWNNALMSALIIECKKWKIGSWLSFRDKNRQTILVLKPFASCLGP